MGVILRCPQTDNGVSTSKYVKNTLRLTQLLKVCRELLQTKKELALNGLCDERLLAVMTIIAKDGRPLVLRIHLLF